MRRHTRLATGLLLLGALALTSANCIIEGFVLDQRTIAAPVGGAGGQGATGGAVGGTIAPGGQGGGTAGGPVGGTGGSGGSLLSLGDPCADSAQCASGHCADDVCCEAACASDCQQCNQAGQEGTCLSLAVQTPCGAGDSGLCDGVGQCATGEHRFSDIYGGTGEERGRSVAFDAQGNVILAGEFESPTDFGGGPLENNLLADKSIFLAKFSPLGEHLWSSAIGTEGDFSCWDVIVDPAQNILLTGSFNGVIDVGGDLVDSNGSWASYVMKFTKDGNYLWNYVWHGQTLYYPQLVATDAMGNVVVAAPYEGWVDVGDGNMVPGGQIGSYVLRLDTDGAFHWGLTTTNSGQGMGVALSLAVDPSGDAFVAGWLDYTNMSIGGIDLTHSGIGTEAWVARIGPLGVVPWAKRYGDMLTQSAEGVAVDPTGNVWVVGSFNGSINFGGGDLPNYSDTGSSIIKLDVFLAKLDADGDHLWSKSFGPFHSYAPLKTSVTTDGNGNVIFMGQMGDPVDFGFGPLPTGNQPWFMTKLSGGGVPLWSQSFLTEYTQGGSPPDNRHHWLSRLRAAGDGSVGLATYTWDSVDYGGGALESAGHFDAALAVFEP